MELLLNIRFTWNDLNFVEFHWAIAKHSLIFKRSCFILSSNSHISFAWHDILIEHRSHIFWFLLIERPDKKQRVDEVKESNFGDSDFTQVQVKKKDIISKHWYLKEVLQCLLQCIASSEFADSFLRKCFLVNVARGYSWIRVFKCQWPDGKVMNHSKIMGGGCFLV